MRALMELQGLLMRKRRFNDDFIVPDDYYPDHEELLTHYPSFLLSSYIFGSTTHVLRNQGFENDFVSAIAFKS